MVCEAEGLRSTRFLAQFQKLKSYKFPYRTNLCVVLALLSLALPMLRAADDKPKTDQIRGD